MFACTLDATCFCACSWQKFSESPGLTANIEMTVNYTTICQHKNCGKPLQGV